MWRRFLSEPLVHFALAGLAIFGLFALADDTPATPVANQINVTEADALWLAGQYEATWRRPPRPNELDTLIDEFIKEEMLVREALALGLDQNDTIVRRRLRQKMEFLADAPAASATPTDEVLTEFFEENAEVFSRPVRVSFEQILLDEGAAVDDVLALISDGTDPQSVNAGSLLPYAVPLSQRTAVDGAFGTGFFAQLLELPVNEWQGPVTSGFGVHLVRVASVEDTGLPDFEEVRDRVELEWRTSQTEIQRTRFLEVLASGYEITRPVATEVLE